MNIFHLQVLYAQMQIVLSYTSMYLISSFCIYIYIDECLFYTCLIHLNMTLIIIIVIIIIIIIICLK